MSTHEDRIEKTLGIMTGDFSGDIPAPESRIEVFNSLGSIAGDVF